MKVIVFAQTFFIIILTVSGQCPGPSNPLPQLWSITIDTYQNMVYFVLQNETSNYWQMSASNSYFNASLMQPMIFRQDYLSFSLNVHPSASTLGFSSNSYFNINGNQVTIQSNENYNYGSLISTSGIYTYNITINNLGFCAGFGYPSSQNSGWTSFGMYFCFSNSGFSQSLEYVSNSCYSYNPYPCNYACNTCFGPGQGNCLSCAQYTFPQPNNPYGCGYGCPSGYVNDYSTYTCKTCAQLFCSPGSCNSQGCTACISGYYLYGYTCYPCQLGCISCSSSEYCDACMPGFEDIGGCDPTCFPGSYRDLTTYTCENCYDNCHHCTYLNVCTLCATGYYLMPGTHHCISTCPTNYYPDPKDNMCRPCDPACHSCTLGTPYFCGVCNPNYFLQPDSTVCLSTCPPGYWPNSLTNACGSCSPECHTCTRGTNSTCTTCSSGYYFQPNSTTCQRSCPSGYYVNDTASSCYVCNPACSSCTGASEIECLVCNAGFYLQPSSNTTCLNSCPVGYWGNDNSNICSPCSFNCSACLGGEATDCVSCASGYYLQPYSSVCDTSCPLGYYQNTTINSCRPCHSYCSNCTGPDSDDCFSCEAGYYLQPDSTTCNNTCPSIGYWPDFTNNACEPCTFGCNTCLTTKKCLSCEPRYFLQPSSSVCDTSCPEGYYENSLSQRCSTCDKACAACTNSSDSMCTKCNPGYYLQSSSTICLSQCPKNGYWADPSENICANCPADCQTCKGNTGCTSCYPGFYLQPSTYGCMNSCPSGYYANSSSSTCDPCNNCTTLLSTSEYTVSYNGIVGIILGGCTLALVGLILFALYIHKATQLQNFLKNRYKIQSRTETV